MFLLRRVAYVRAAVQQAPWHSVALGLASWIVIVGAPAVFVGIVLTIESGASAKGFVTALWVVLVVGVLLFAGGLWAWRVSGLVDKEVKGRYHGLREVESERLLVRRPVPQDAIALAAAIDAEMLAGNGWTEREARTMVKAVRSGYPVPGLLVFEARSDGALVGGATVHPSATDPSSRALGWWIGPRHRRAGYASEAVAALVAAIHDAGFTTVEIGTSESNLAVRRICDKIGATEKDRRAQRLPNGSLVPSIWYEHRQVATDEPSVSPAG
ncbi:RimJ/RimL family protein N-acetyltransferase [Nocardia ignorata]|uniref:RimJ/RimL family protein N-acetyltransferase n=1 Tax=Nocardia ignorata TaxID=145285 RepID=A0A4R6PMA1_NOCIG|nr:RimJ/RimL family protein N-acetyltransferase [Nocardia ignorata]